MHTLTLDEVRDIAPSVFHTERKAGLSDRYQPYTTGEVVKPLLKDGWMITQAGQSASKDPTNRFFRRHLLRLSHPSMTHLSDAFRIDALITNSNDGKHALNVQLGAYVFACTNGIVDGEDFDSVSIRHLYPELKVQEACATIVARAPKVAEKLEDWRGFRLSEDQINAFLRYAAKLRFGDSANAPDLNVVRRGL